MAIQYGKLCSLLLEEHFGETVTKVSNELHWGPGTLTLISTSTGLPLLKVKKALGILIQHGLVSFERGKLPSIAEYSLNKEKILLFLRYPRYLTLIEKKIGLEARALLEELMKYGFDTATNIILRVSARAKEGLVLTDGSLPALRDKLSELIHLQYLMRYPSPSTEDIGSVPVLNVKESHLFHPPTLDIANLSQLNQGLEATDPGDSGIYWRINFERFHQDMRDEIMVTAIERRFDEHASQLMSQLLRLMYLRTDAWAVHSNPVPLVELRDAIAKRSSNPYLTVYLDQYLKIIEESSGFISKYESSSGLIEVNLSKAIYELTCTAIDNIVDQRFGSKAARIFRLVRSKKYMEQDQIQQLAMIPDKEAKQLTYKLLQENFLQIQELRKPTVGSGPNKTFFLFHVDLNQVGQMVLETCHKALYNTLIRRTQERNDHQRLMQKRERIEALAESMREQGTDEEEIQPIIDDWFSPPERNLLASVEAMIKKLQLAELQVDDTLLLLQLFTYYQSSLISLKPVK